MPFKIIKVDEKNVEEINNLHRDKATVLFFHPSCIHCMMMKQQWESMKNKLRNRNMNGRIYEVNGTCMDRVTHPIRDKVMGFPTIMNVNNGSFQENFEQERSTENMYNFVSQNAFRSPKKNKKNTRSKGKKSGTGTRTRKRVRFQNVENSINLALQRRKSSNNKKKKGPRKSKKQGMGKK